MKSLRACGARRILLAAIAAFCLVTFGSLPHANAAFAAAAGSASAPGSTIAATHHSPEVVTRTQAASGVGELSALPAADLGRAGLELALAGLLIALLLRAPRTAVRYRTGPASGRAPPLAA